MAFYNINVPCFEIGDEICHFLGMKSAMLAPRMVFWEPLGTKPCLLPELDQIWFGGHILVNNKINVPSFEIGDEIFHFLGTKSAMSGPQNLGTAFPRFLAIFI